MKFKITAHRLDSENRNTVLWNKNYRNTAQKITQYLNTANPYAPLLKKTRIGEISIFKLPHWTAKQGREEADVTEI